MKQTKTTPAIYAIFTFILLFCITSTAFSAENNYSSVEERRIEKTILEERAKIRKEREEIDLRKKELKSLEEGVDKKLTEIDSKLESLKSLQNRIKALLEEKSAIEQKQIESLAKIYEKMIPAKAALALTGLEQQLASDLLGKMKVKSAAKILDQLSKQKTTEISTTYTTLQLE
jgi:flagellar motility protein MotE (MotC chaperone)